MKNGPEILKKSTTFYCSIKIDNYRTKQWRMHTLIKTSNKERTRLEGIPHGISQSHKKEATSGFVKYSGAV